LSEGVQHVVGGKRAVRTMFNQGMGVSDTTHHAMLHMPACIEEVGRGQDRQRDARRAEPLPDGGLLGDRQTGEFGPMPEGDPALPPHLLRERAHERVI
jgi:hypothetical protein